MEPKKLAKLLVEGKLVERFVIDQTLVKLARNETLADRLVADGVISEGDLLRVIAQATNTRFVSSPRLASLKVPQEVLELIPKEAAEAHDVVPIAVDPKQKALVVVLADPAKLPALDKLPRVARMDHVTANVALPGAVRAAIHRLYASHGVTRQMPTPSGQCPQCKAPFFEAQLECAGCGLLLNADAPVDRSDSRIVRALLSVPTGKHHVLSRAQVHEGPTRFGLPVPVTDEQVPQLVAGVDIAGSLAEFDAFLVSFIDGVLTVGALAQTTGLMSVEVRSAIASLTERKVLRLSAPAVVFDPELDTEPRPIPQFEPEFPGKKRRTLPVKRPEPAPAPKAPPPAPIEARELSAEAQMENSLQHALSLERRGKVTGAISVLNTAIARSPSPAPLYNRLALVILNQRRDAKQAEQLIQKAIELEPENTVYRENLAKVLMFAAVKSKKR